MKSIYVCNWLPLLWIGLGILAYLTGIVGLIITKNMKGMTWGAVPLGLLIFIIVGPIGFVCLIIGMFNSRVNNK